jgi:hypothetical protein
MQRAEELELAHRRPCCLTDARRRPVAPDPAHIAGEQLANRERISDVHAGPEHRQPDGENAPVSRVPRTQNIQGPEREACQVHHGRSARTKWQCHMPSLSLRAQPELAVELDSSLRAACLTPDRTASHPTRPQRLTPTAPPHTRPHRLTPDPTAPPHARPHRLTHARTASRPRPPQSHAPHPAIPPQPPPTSRPDGSGSLMLV